MTQPTTDKYINALLEGRYKILSRVGEGGMAVVYKALDTRLDRNVAVKIMRDELLHDEEFRQRFCAESHAVAMLSHPNIVSVFDVSHNDDIEYIVMELISGITLRQYLNRKGRISWKEVLHFSRQVVAALSHAHQRGIIHRDIKPQNIMLLRDGTIKVADFGIAALENEFSEANSQAIGSLNYISPEQARGQGPDARSDIYSVGVMMYELLCGQKPYEGNTPAEIVKLQMDTDSIVPIRTLVPDVPAILANIVAKAMNPNVLQRYQSAADLLSDLEHFTSDYTKKEHLSKLDVQQTKKQADNVRKQKKYFEFIKRSSRVSSAFGLFGVLTCVVLVFGFLWNFWLGDVFSPAVRITLPDFTGYSYADISNDANLVSRYNFNVNYVVDPSLQSGTVISQEPKAGRSLMLTSDGIDVSLSVATGNILKEVPNVSGVDYREAVLQLQNSGFVAEVSNVTSETITKDCVISTSPSAGESISAGSTVYVYVSSGTDLEYIQVPNVVGLTEDAAIAKLEAAGLSYGGATREESDYEAGTVISQSKVAFSEVEEHTSITLTISTGTSVAAVEAESGNEGIYFPLPE